MITHNETLNFDTYSQYLETIITPRIHKLALAEYIKISYLNELKKTFPRVECIVRRLFPIISNHG